jgi:hypothetical protein
MLKQIIKNAYKNCALITVSEYLVRFCVAFIYRHVQRYLEQNNLYE